MKREIKFRAYSNNEMQYSNGLVDFGFWKWVGYDSTTEVMQYTGLHDKNGKEIYEGDVFKWGSYIGVVEFGDGCFVFPLINEPISMTMRDHDQSEFEVIGNIFETPDLLK